MRFELNISVKKPDAKELPNYKVEVKNIGSISVLEKVIEFEIDRQAALLEKGETPINETRGIRDLSGITYSQRTKETEGDYRYFPEPDIPPLLISEKQIEDTKDTQPELPAARKQRYMQDWGLEGEQVEILVEQSDKGDWMDDFQQETRLDSALIAEAVKWFIGDISGLLEKNNLNVAELPITHTDLAYLVEALGENKISGSIVKKVLDMIFSGEEKSAEDIVSKQNLEQVSDPKELQVWAKAAIKENPQLVASLEKNPNAIKALVGQVMKLSRGRANPQLVESILHELLKVRA
jgi:aspartyl-tRNA(Asn)/glutamyl-tRNA(Gln) amidotransferase subunit B